MHYEKKPELFETLLEKVVAIYRSVIGAHRNPDPDDPFHILGAAGFISFLVTGYDTTTLFIGEDVNSPERWEKAVVRMVDEAIEAASKPAKNKKGKK